MAHYRVHAAQALASAHLVLRVRLHLLLWHTLRHGLLSAVLALHGLLLLPVIGPDSRLRNTKMRGGARVM